MVAKTVISVTADHGLVRLNLFMPRTSIFFSPVNLVVIPFAESHRNVFSKTSVSSLANGAARSA